MSEIIWLFAQTQGRKSVKTMKPGTIYKLVQELKRRRVFRGIVVYGASTLILLEAAQNICSVFGIEEVPVWFIWLLGAG